MIVEFLTNCTFVYSKLTPPTTTVYAVLFTVTGIFATFGNLISMAILLQPRMRNKSTNVLFSLALSDTLVGIVLGTYTAYELIETHLLRDCRYEFARLFLTVSFIGVSAVNVGLIAYERYVVLTMIEPHHTGTESKRTTALILLSWILPGGLYAAFHFNYYLRNILICLLIIGPLISLTTFYGLIRKAIKGKHVQIRSDSKLDDLQRKEDEKLRKLQHARHLKLTKAVIYLIVSYIICLIPATVAIVMNVVYVVRKISASVATQHYYLFSVLGCALNSCINPIIYAAKYPEFRNIMREMWTKLRKKELFSSTGTADDTRSEPTRTIN